MLLTLLNNLINFVTTFVTCWNPIYYKAPFSQIENGAFSLIKGIGKR